MVNMTVTVSVSVQTVTVSVTVWVRTQESDALNAKHVPLKTRMLTLKSSFDAPNTHLPLKNLI